MSYDNLRILVGRLSFSSSGEIAIKPWHCRNVDLLMTREIHAKLPSSHKIDFRRAVDFNIITWRALLSIFRLLKTCIWKTETYRYKIDIPQSQICTYNIRLPSRYQITLQWKQIYSTIRQNKKPVLGLTSTKMNVYLKKNGFWACSPTM